jgi:hypothetical protein
MIGIRCQDAGTGAKSLIRFGCLASPPIRSARPYASLRKPIASSGKPVSASSSRVNR